MPSSENLGHSFVKTFQILSPIQVIGERWIKVEREHAVAESLATLRAEIGAIDREIALVQRLMRQIAADRPTRTGNPPAGPAGEKPQA